jgi:hypothetical protein
MANGDEPERIFQQAISLLRAQEILKKRKTGDHDEAVALVMTTSLLQAFTIELLCVIHDQWKRLPNRLEPVRRQLGVTHRVLNVLMPERS